MANREAHRNQNQYNSTSSAYDYLPHKKRPVKKNKRGLKYVRAENPGHSMAGYLYLVIGVLFLCGISCVYSISNVNNQKLINYKLAQQLKTEQSKTADMMAESAQVVDLEKIEKIAREKLQMSEPQSHQIRYITVMKQNYSVQYSDSQVLTGEESPADSVIGAIKNFISKLLY